MSSTPAPNHSVMPAVPSRHGCNSAPPPVIPLQDRLSPRAMAQILRIQQGDSSLMDPSSWEKEFSEALEELEAIESVTGSLFKTVIQLRRHQTAYDGRVLQLEEEIKRVDERLGEVLEPTKASFLKAELALRKGNKSLDNFKLHCTGHLDDLQLSLKKAERDLSVLQSQWGLYKERLDDLQGQFIPTEEKTQLLALQCAAIERQDEELWGIIAELQNRLMELERRSEGDVHLLFNDTSVSLAGSDVPSSLDIEILGVQGHISGTSAYAVPMRDSDGWWTMPEISVEPILEDTLTSQEEGIAVAIQTTGSSSQLPVLERTTSADDKDSVRMPVTTLSTDSATTQRWNTAARRALLAQRAAIFWDHLSLLSLMRRLGFALASMAEREMLKRGLPL
ncbi:hypothetical protein BN946_scf184881.g4 [Trametes cinnabarina]|uniref:Uncharacterized protein n=1 Tax=Pycnoporus cinnabarinus TaxID=5643 RepID=A0A060STJ8_PYCCI|nr:hypothetical protein BN946_scf184881.g4 [Trametes cinnabarina]